MRSLLFLSLFLLLLSFLSAQRLGPRLPTVLRLFRSVEWFAAVDEEDECNMGENEINSVNVDMDVDEDLDEDEAKRRLAEALRQHPFVSICQDSDEDSEQCLCLRRKPRNGGSSRRFRVKCGTCVTLMDADDSPDGASILFMRPS